MSLVVPCVADVVVTASGPIEHLCPHVDEVDRGQVKITWRANGATFELHALAKYLRAWADTEMSHEEITNILPQHLGIYDGIELLAVETTWETAGMEVRCSTSPTPVETL